MTVISRPAAAGACAAVLLYLAVTGPQWAFTPWFAVPALTLLAGVTAYALHGLGARRLRLFDAHEGTHIAPRRALDWPGLETWRKPQLALPSAEKLVTGAREERVISRSPDWPQRFEPHTSPGTEIVSYDEMQESHLFHPASEECWLKDCRWSKAAQDAELAARYGPAVLVTDDPPAGRHEAPRVHAFTPGGDPYCGKCGKAGHWRGGQSCADAVVDELITRRRDDHVTAAITAHLADAGFRGHGGDTGAMLDSIIGGIPAVQP